MANSTRQTNTRSSIHSPSNPQLINDVVELTADQVALYQRSILTLQGPDGAVVDVIGHDARDPGNADNVDAARNILQLLECLVVNQNGGLELSESASVGLAEVLLHAQQLLEQ